MHCCNPPDALMSADPNVHVAQSMDTADIVACLPQLVVGLAAMTEFDALGDNGDGGVPLHMDAAATEILLQRLGLLRSVVSHYLEWWREQQRQRPAPHRTIKRITLNVRRENTVALDAYTHETLGFVYHSPCVGPQMAGFDVYVLREPKLTEVRESGRSLRLPETLTIKTLANKRDEMVAAAVRNEKDWTERPPHSREEASLMQVWRAAEAGPRPSFSCELRWAARRRSRVSSRQAHALVAKYLHVSDDPQILQADRKARARKLLTPEPEEAHHQAHLTSCFLRPAFYILRLTSYILHLAITSLALASHSRGSSYGCHLLRMAHRLPGSSNIRPLTRLILPPTSNIVHPTAHRFQRRLLRQSARMLWRGASTTSSRSCRVPRSSASGCGVSTCASRTDERAASSARRRR